MKIQSPQKIQAGRTKEELFTLNPVASGEQPAHRQVDPVYIRLPKPGTLCPYTSLSRSILNGLILGPGAPVKSVSLRKRHTIRGVRLIHLQSLLEYLEGFAAPRNTGTE